MAIQNVDEFLEKGALETSNREGFLKFLQSFSSFVDGHHLVENEKVFPYFMDKLPEVPYKGLMDQHKEMEVGLQEINDGITGLRTQKAEVRSLKLFKSGLGKIDEIWQPHIRIEESQLYSQVGSLKINSKEMIRLINEVSELFQEHTGPPYLIAPFILYNLSPEDRAIQARGFPEIVVKQLVPIDWKDKWAPMQPYLLK